MSNPPTGTVTFLFTDIEGSTKRWEHQPLEMDSALARHDAILAQAIQAGGGYVFKTVGDAFCAAFPTPLDALTAALAAQLALHSEPWPPETGPIRVRMALHTGTSIERNGDYFGQPVNRVARLLSAGHGGQVLLSQAAQELVRDHLLPGVQLLDFGERRLKDLVRPERVYQLVAPDLPSDFPPLKTLDNRLNNLPVQLTTLIGREKEIEAIKQRLISDDMRLVTLTGPGGTGKTRLGLQVAAELLDGFRDGVFFVDLAPITDYNLVVSEIAQTLGIRESADKSLIASLKDYLREKQILLVLDNFEQVLQAAPVVTQMLQSAPNIKVMSTSRARLQVRGEKEYPVPPLSLPDITHLPPLERLTQYEAVRLFIERAVEVKPDFEVNNGNAPAVTEICVRLDGLPLAIELAAARIKILTPQAMLTRLQSRLKMLTGGAKDLPARQQTLRNTIEWSYDLLDEGEKQLFLRLAVFQGGRTLEAIEAVCNAESDLQIDVLDGVQSLVSKSLMRPELGEAQEPDEQGGEPRFLMLETIHEFAREKLEESGEAEEVQKRHAAYFLALVEGSEPELDGPHQAQWFSRFELEHDNLRAALSWALRVGEVEVLLRFGAVLWIFWYARNHYGEGVTWLKVALAKSNDLRVPARAAVLRGAGRLVSITGDFEGTETLFEESLGIYRELGDKLGVAWALRGLGALYREQGAYARAEEVYHESLRIARELGNKDHIARCLNVLGDVARAQGDYEKARGLYEDSLPLQREANDTLQLTMVLMNLGFVDLYERNYDGASSFALESLMLSQQIGDKFGVAICLVGLAGIAIAAEGHPKGAERAITILGAAEAIREETGAQWEAADLMEYQRYLAAAHTELNEATWQAAWAEGQAMTLDKVIEYALEGIEAGHE